jgi:hypothetical protein
MPGRTLDVNIVTTNAGVPSILDGDTLIPLDAGHIGWLVALCIDTPDIIDEAFNAIKANLSVIAGIDPMLPNDDWWQEFNALMVIVQYQPALSALQQARHQAASMMEATR